EGNEEVAADDIKTAVRLVVSALREKRWSYFDELSFLARESIMFFSADGDPVKRLRATSLWLRFAERLRRSYVESEWGFDDEGNELPRNRAFLVQYESFITDVRLFRADLLNVFGWLPEVGKYVDTKIVPPNASSENEDASSGNDDNFDKIVDLRLLFRLDDRDAFARRRYAAATGKLKDDPASLAVFCDLDYCLRVARRRVFEGEFQFGQTLLAALGKLTEVYDGMSEPVLGIVEINETASLFDYYGSRIAAKSGESQGDALFWSSGYRVWELQARALDEFSKNWTALSEKDDSNLPEDKELRKSLFENLKTLTEHAFLQSLLALKYMSPDDSTYPVNVASSYSRYYQWLGRYERYDEALEIARKEGETLERRAKKPSALYLLTVSLFYESIASVALEDRRPDAAKRALFKLKDSLSNEEKFLKGRAVVAERFARMYARFAVVAQIEGQKNEAIDQVKKSLDRLEEVFERGQEQPSAFSLLCEGIGFLFSNGTDEDKRIAARRYKLAERYFRASPPLTRRDLFNDFWGASVAVFEWESSRRCCCRRAGQIAEHFKEFGKHYVGEDPAVYAFRRINACFYQSEYGLRFSKVAQAREATKDVVALLEKRYRSMKSQTSETLETPSDDPEANVVARQLVAALSFEIMIDFFLCDRSESSAKAIETGLAITKSLPEARTIFEPRKSWARNRLEIFRENWKKRKSSQALLKEAGEPSESDQSKKIPFWALPKEWKRRFQEFIADFKGMWKSDISQYDAAIFKACFFFLAYKAVLTFREEGPRAGRAALNDVLARNVQIFGRSSPVELTCRFVLVDELIRERRWNEAVKETNRAFNLIARSPEVVGEFDPVEVGWRLNCLRMRALALLERRRFGDLRAAEKILDQALQKCRRHLRRGLLALRGSYYELLLLEARIDAARGKKDEALRLARRIRRAFVASTKRGIKILTKDSILSLDDLLT
ncbi:MAG: hypothetical protein J6X44_08450, partial [Thermoguttaceae bacterium]|nr:hypothetical protein [Thermoguttaceae bacterium]